MEITVNTYIRESLSCSRDNKKFAFVCATIACLCFMCRLLECFSSIIISVLYRVRVHFFTSRATVQFLCLFLSTNQPVPSLFVITYIRTMIDEDRCSVVDLIDIFFLIYHLHPSTKKDKKFNTVHKIKSK